MSIFRITLATFEVSLAKLALDKSPTTICIPCETCPNGKLKDWTYQCKEYGESEDEEVPGWVEIDELEVGQPHGRDHSEHDAEDATHNRFWGKDVYVENSFNILLNY